MLKVLSEGYGFSTNSSGTHDVIIDKEKNIFYDYGIDLSDQVGFGRNYWIANTKLMKTFYLICQLNESLGDISDFYKSKIFHQMINQFKFDTNYKKIHDIISGSNFRNLSLYIDHGNLWNLPNNLPEKFLNELIEFLYRDDVVIIGGTDEVEATYYDNTTQKGRDNIEKEIKYSLQDRFYEENKVNKNKKNIELRNYFDQLNKQYIPTYRKVKKCKKEIFTFDTFSNKPENNIFRYDPKGFWVIFNKGKAKKTRLTFHGDKVHSFEKSTFPELIDLNITDYCNKNCEWCYRNCNKKGKHVDYEFLKEIRCLFSNFKLIELSLSGGEVTRHPRFADILDDFGSIIPIVNFTTYDDKWLSDEYILNKVRELVSGIGVSVHNKNDIKLINKINNVVNSTRDYYSVEDYKENIKCKVVAQHVFGTLPYEEFIDFLNEIKNQYIPLLLLGYKEVGKGNNFKKINYTEDQMTEIFSIIGSLYKLSIDIKFGNLYEKYLDKIHIDRDLYSKKEGLFSCYIDPIKGIISTSSYEGKVLPFFKPGFIYENDSENRVREVSNIIKEQFALL